MRKTIMILTAILGIGTLMLSSCSKDKKVERKLRGEWSVKGRNVDNNQKVTADIDVSILGDCTFKKNNTGNCNYNVDVSYVIIDSVDTIKFYFTQQVQYEISEWKIEGDLLYITYSDGTQEVFIIAEYRDDYFYLQPYGDESANMEFVFMSPDGDMMTVSFKYELELTRK